MPRKKSSTPAEGGKKRRRRRNGLEALISKVAWIEQMLGAFLAPKYASAGEVFKDGVKGAQTAMLTVRAAVRALPPTWKPVPKFVPKPMTAEAMKKLEARIARDQERLAAAKALMQEKK